MVTVHWTGSFLIQINKIIVFKRIFSFPHLEFRNYSFVREIVNVPRWLGLFANSGETPTCNTYIAEQSNLYGWEGFGYHR